MRFKDRADAGRRLAARLERFRVADVVVLGLPRGGVPIGAEVARALGAPLDVILVRKLGVPYQPELGMGAIGEGGIRVLNPRVVQAADVAEHEIEAVERRERAELERRARLYRDDRPRIPLEGRTALVVDDGIATGSTARAACRVARALGASRVVLAAPVAPAISVRELAADADEVVVLDIPEEFRAIGQFYDDFVQVTDEQVMNLLSLAAAVTPGTASAADDPPVMDAEVEIRADDARLHGHLTIPESARGIVVFAHGSGSSRHSPRNRFVATILNQAALGTLLFDLLTTDEETDRSNVFDIELLARRLAAATRWLRAVPEASDLPVGYFGASTGAGAALLAATDPTTAPAAIVSRGGRPDLAAPRLGEVRAPTLLIVGGLDDAVLELNRGAQARLRCESRLSVVPGATHLFEEPGTLQQAAELARDWFVRGFGGTTTRPVRATHSESR
jgi:putative phosphoribosyl transferase